MNEEEAKAHQGAIAPRQKKIIIIIIIITIIIIKNKKRGNMYTDECIDTSGQKCPEKDSRN